MPHTSTSQAATRFAVPRGMLVGFVIAALATVLIALVNFRTAQVRAQAVEAMDETTVTMRFEPLEDGRTLVSIHEAGWRENPAGQKASYGNCEGWTGMLCAMRVYIEHGINLREGFYK